MSNTNTNNISSNNMNLNPQLKRLFDSSPDAPKLITRGGKFTKKFLDWNRKKLRQGLTIYYADPDYFYNSTTERIVKKDLKQNGEERKYSLKIPRQGSTLIQNKGIYEKEFLPQNYKDNLYIKEPLNTYSWWYKILKSFEGQTIRVIIKYYIADPTIKIDDTPAQKFIESIQETFNGAYNFVFDNTYEIPPNWTRKQYDEDKFYYEFMVNSDFPNIVAYLLANNIKTRIIITKLLDLEDKKVFQSFAQGPTHCVLQPILDYFENALKSQSSKSQMAKNLTAINNIKGKYLKKTNTHKEGFLDKYKKGIPEDELADLCNTLQIGIQIDKPFSIDPYINVRSHSKPRKVFKYLNSQEDHAELCRGNHKLTTTDYSKDNIIESSREELEDIKHKLLENREHYVYSRNKWGLTTIKTFNKIYKLPNDYREIANEFEKQFNINSFKIDALTNPDLQRFINRGCHFNCCRDFQDLPKITNPELRHIDIYKAYTQYEKCKYYDGFLGKITDFRRVDTYDHKGYYYIHELNFDNANKKFVFYNKKLKWFKNRNIYTDAELRFLKDQGADFKVYVGAFGNQSYKFTFPKEMIDGKILLSKVGEMDIKISMYAKWVGEQASLNYTNQYCMDGTQSYFEGLKTPENRIYFDEIRQEAKITYPSNHVYNKRHIAGQITAYQRLLMMEQLLDMDETKIIRVCVDGIYYYNHTITPLDIFRDKTHEMTFNNAPSTSYLSSMFNEGEDSIADVIFGKSRALYNTELWSGQGGTGKTYTNIRDKGHIDMLYISPSWKLARKVQEEIKENNLTCDVSVNARVLDMEFCERLQQKYNVFLWDEVSQMTEYTKQRIINKIPGKHIFMGDIGYQLEPVIDNRKLQEKYVSEDTTLDFYKWKKEQGHTEMTKENIDNVITLTKDIRAKDCEDLQEVKLQLRKYIDMMKYKKQEEKQQIRQQVLNYIKSKCDKIELDTLDKEYKVKDMILASRHDVKDTYTKRFYHLDKFLVKNNTKDYSNSQIVYEIPNEFIKLDRQHAFTIHSIQGETIDKENNLYIDLKHMFSDNHIYTAVSRARNLKQIKLIY